jgi:hypothetical protein
MDGMVVLLRGFGGGGKGHFSSPKFAGPPFLGHLLNQKKINFEKNKIELQVWLARLADLVLENG